MAGFGLLSPTVYLFLKNQKLGYLRIDMSLVLTNAKGFCLNTNTLDGSQIQISTLSPHEEYHRTKLLIRGIRKK